MIQAYQSKCGLTTSTWLLYLVATRVILPKPPIPAKEITDRHGFPVKNHPNSHILHFQSQQDIFDEKTRVAMTFHPSSIIMQNGSFLILLQFDASQRYSWECKWLIQKPSVVLTRILQPILVIHEVVDDVFHITGHGLHIIHPGFLSLGEEIFLQRISCLSTPS